MWKIKALRRAAPPFMRGLNSRLEVVIASVL